jgi:hypothetical protein
VAFILILKQSQQLQLLLTAGVAIYVFTINSLSLSCLILQQRAYAFVSRLLLRLRGTVGHSRAAARAVIYGTDIPGVRYVSPLPFDCLLFALPVLELPVEKAGMMNDDMRWQLSYDRYDSCLYMSLYSVRTTSMGGLVKYV